MVRFVETERKTQVPGTGRIGFQCRQIGSRVDGGGSHTTVWVSLVYNVHGKVAKTVDLIVYILP